MVMSSEVNGGETMCIYWMAGITLQWNININRTNNAAPTNSHPKGNLEGPIYLRYLLLDGERKPEHTIVRREDTKYCTPRNPGGDGTATYCTAMQFWMIFIRSLLLR